ncbi:hypothetical protein KCU95_g10912, partial [Aureobasidium melanogenum]
RRAERKQAPPAASGPSRWERSGAPTPSESPAASAGGPPRLNLAGNKPSWREREAAKAAGGAASPAPEATRPAAPAPAAEEAPKRSGYVPPHMRGASGAAPSSDSAPPAAAPRERWAPRTPRGDGEAPPASGGRYEAPSSRGGSSGAYRRGGFGGNRN